jgi:hypothetical protein
MDTSTLPMRHEIYGTDMESRIFDPAGDLNGSTVTLWASPNGWSVTVQYRSPYTEYTKSSHIPLCKNVPEDQARDAYRVTVLERDGSYMAETRRLA